MTVLKQNLGHRLEHSPVEDKNWWVLCFDTASYDLYVLSKLTFDDRFEHGEGHTSKRMTIQNYMRLKHPGSNKLEQGIRKMFASEAT